jgi:hypothetical protein
VGGDGLADDEAILNELADGLAGVGVGDFALLAWVEPDLALAAADDCERSMLASLPPWTPGICFCCAACVYALAVATEGVCRVRYAFVTDLRRRGASGCED